jgi:hypothetical protein
MTAPVRRTTVWADTLKTDVCKDASCRREIVFVQNAKTGRVMPFDAPLLPIAIDDELGRRRWTVDLAGSHFATCPGAHQFRRAR